jgi:hypothetical protein
MKKLIVGIILALVMLVPFINKIADTADSAQDWTLGIVLIVVVLGFACWLLTRPDRSEAPNGSVTVAVSSSSVTVGNSVRTEGLPATAPAVPVCAACGAASRGTKFCLECGKPLQPKSACPQCGCQYPSGTKFCPECGTKIG